MACISSAPCLRGPPRGYAFCVLRRRWESARADGRRGAPGSTLTGPPGCQRRTPRVQGVHRGLPGLRARVLRAAGPIGAQSWGRDRPVAGPRCREGRRRRALPRPDGAEDCEAAQARRRKATTRGPANAACMSSAPCLRGPPRGYAFCVLRRRRESIRADGRRGPCVPTLAGQPGGQRRTPRVQGVHRALQRPMART